jgi:hypothetical protein
VPGSARSASVGGWLGPEARGAGLLLPKTSSMLVGADAWAQILRYVMGAGALQDHFLVQADEVLHGVSKVGICPPLEAAPRLPLKGAVLAPDGEGCRDADR